MTLHLDDDLDELLGQIGEEQARQPGRAPSLTAMTDTALGDLLGVTGTRVRQLVTEGVLTRPLRQRDAVRAYCSWLREKASRGVAVEDDLKREKIRQAREAADKLALQNAAARGELIAASDVESTWAGILRDVRAGLLAVPSRCGATLPHLTPHDVSSIDREIKAALEGLSDGR